jgi:MerR family mercuric resistance operon transcriptional regulator
MASYTRKTLAERLGIGIETLRYYERIGILPLPARGANGYRYYGEADVGVIEHILVAKKFGFTLKEIMEFRRAMEGTDAKDVDIVPLLRKKLKDVRAQMASLGSLGKSLEELIKSTARKKG